MASGERIARLFSAVAEAVQQEFQPSQFRNVETLSHSLQVDDAAEHRLVLAQLADASWLAVTFRDSPF